MVTLTQQGDTQCPHCLIKHPGYGYGNFCSRDCYNRYDGRSLCPQCSRPTHLLDGICVECLRASNYEESKKKDKKFAKAANPKTIPKIGDVRCIEEGCIFPRRKGWLRCSRHLTLPETSKQASEEITPKSCSQAGCRYNRKPGFILCSIHLDAIIEVNNRHVATSDEPKEGPAMTTQTYAKDVLLGYAQDKIEEFEEVIEDHANSDVEVLRQLVKDVEDDKVKKDNLLDEYAARQDQSRHELLTKHDGFDVCGARRHLKLLNRLVRRLEAIDGDTLELTDSELKEMEII